MRYILPFVTILLFFSIKIYSQDFHSAEKDKFNIGIGAAYGFDKFNENEIKETADEFNLIPYSSPVYEHNSAYGVNLFSSYQLTELFLINVDISYLSGFKSSYTILDVLIDYEKAYFDIDILTFYISPGIKINVDEKSNFYLSAGLGILHRKLDVYQEVRINQSVITNMNPRTINCTALSSTLSVQYTFNLFTKINLFLKANYNIGFGKLKQSNFIQLSAGAAYTL